MCILRTSMMAAAPDVDPTPRWPLNPVENGMSTTELAAPFSQVTNGSTAINLHQSPADETPNLCGDIERAG
jgi:hypothetical protein